MLDERRADELGRTHYVGSRNGLRLRLTSCGWPRFTKASLLTLCPSVCIQTAMLQAAHDAQPRRASMVEEAFSNSGETTFHSLQHEGDDW